MSAENERDKGWWLSELLAIIHRDGGHYESIHGTQKAVEDAHTILAAALSIEPGEAEGWRDMSSAPRDGTKFLAFEKGRYFDCWWEDKGYGEAYWMDEADSEPNPSAWRILPAAPLPEESHHGLTEIEQQLRVAIRAFMAYPSSSDEGKNALQIIDDLRSVKNLLLLLDELSRLREENAKLRADLAFADEQGAKVEALLEPHIKWDSPPVHEPGTIRICPMRDGPCRHGLHCPYVGDGYMGYPCKEGWNGPRALPEREGQE